MLVETKAKIGVFSIALGAYLPQFPSLVPEFEAQYEAFKKTIPDTAAVPMHFSLRFVFELAMSHYAYSAQMKTQSDLPAVPNCA